MDMTLAFLVAITLALAGLLLVARAMARRAAVDSSPNLIGIAMRHEGLTPADASLAGLEDELVHARDRCEACVIAAECRSAMRSAWHPRRPSACPNAALFAELDRLASKVDAA